VALGERPPVVWEKDSTRIDVGQSYRVVRPEEDAESRYQTICEVSGDASLLDTLIGRLAPHGEIVLAGFYQQTLQFAFPPAFMRQARIRVAAEWERRDLESVYQMICDGALCLDGLITHRQSAQEANTAYSTAFQDPACLKMILDWKHLQGGCGIDEDDFNGPAKDAYSRHH